MKKIWIWNHYATSMYKNQGGRHYWFGENLIKEGYKPAIFCANTMHNGDEPITISDRNYKTDSVNDIPFVFVKTSDYKGNGFSRVKNMLMFYKNLFSVSKEYAKEKGKPDVILASSVHPLTMVAGIQIAKKFGVPCICEVRDLWPESIVAYGILKRNSLITKLLYQGEKWIYKNADSIIMTWQGGKDYILEHEWDKSMDIEKIHHISNGVIVDSFDYNSDFYQIEDADLEDNRFKNIIYTGSIRKVNNLGILLDVAKLIQEKGKNDIRFLIYGSGDEKDKLITRCKDENINNVIFKGQVEKRYIPFILKKAYINILHNSSTFLDKYGQSQNKFFEYLAAGKCIIQTYTTGYSILEEYNCGLSASEQNTEEIANIIIKACNDEELCECMGKNARQVSKNFDFRILTKNLIHIIQDLPTKGK